MSKARLDTFSDGLIGILNTIMVLELHTPAGTAWHALGHEPGLRAQLLVPGDLLERPPSHLAAVSRVTGAALWASLLFWLSLIPFGTAWMSEHRFLSIPTAIYGVVLLAAAIAYYVLQTTLLRAEGEQSRLRSALGADLKGKVSPLLYCLGIGLASPMRELASQCTSAWRSSGWCLTAASSVT